MWYVLLLGIGAVGGSAYLFLIFRSVPGAVDARLGKFEEIPEDVGTWSTDTGSEKAAQAERDGLRLERRVLFNEASGKFTHQARYRNVETNRIERIDADVVVRRKRVKQPSS